MKVYKCIKRNNLPITLPVWPTCTTLLLIDRYNPPEWLIEMVILLGIIIWSIEIFTLFCQKEIDLLGKGNEYLSGVATNILIN